MGGLVYSGGLDCRGQGVWSILGSGGLIFSRSFDFDSYMGWDLIFFRE